MVPFLWALLWAPCGRLWAPWGSFQPLGPRNGAPKRNKPTKTNNMGPMRSIGVQRTGKTGQKPKNRKFKKPYIKEVWGLKKWDSGRWDGWGIILGFIPPFFGDIWSRITSETLFLVVIFSILDLGRKKSMVSPSVRKINSGTILFETASKS